MNDTSNNNNKGKGSVLKSLAIAGFIGIIIIISWLAIQFVNIAPQAFSSLASLAESLNQQNEAALEEEGIMTSLTVTSDVTAVDAGEPVKISWNTTNVIGSYVFSYKCTEGVAVDIADGDGLKSIACETNYNIGNTDSLSLNIDSEKERFSEIDYTISFLSTNETEPSSQGGGTITIMNDDIHTIVEEDTITEQVEEVALTEETETVIETPSTNTEIVTNPTPAEPVYEQEFVFTIPTSNPNGKTDLSTKFLATGNIMGNIFIPGNIEKDDNGAIQFEVKNHGTKTSEDWSFTVSLPNGGEYESPVQKPLKPNERAVLTIGFPTIDESSHTFEVELEISDNNSTNNQFEETVSFTN